MKTLDTLALILLAIGGLNWGLVGLFRFDLVAAIFGAGSILATIVYIVVGIAALYTIINWTAMHQRWCKIHTTHAQPS